MHGIFTTGDTNFMQNLIDLTEERVKDVGPPSDYGIFGQGIVLRLMLLHHKARGEVLLTIFSQLHFVFFGLFE